jgi:hypothetical protein
VLRGSARFASSSSDSRPKSSSHARTAGRRSPSAASGSGRSVWSSSSSVGSWGGRDKECRALLGQPKGVTRSPGNVGNPSPWQCRHAAEARGSQRRRCQDPQRASDRAPDVHVRESSSLLCNHRRRASHVNDPVIGTASSGAKRDPKVRALGIPQGSSIDPEVIRNANCLIRDGFADAPT